MTYAASLYLRTINPFSWAKANQGAVRLKGSYPRLRPHVGRSALLTILGITLPVLNNQSREGWARDPPDISH